MPTLVEMDAIKIFRALGDPTRFRIVCTLLARGETSCGELGEMFSLSAPALSHHFRVLQDCGLVEVRKEGVYHFFSLDRGRLEQIVPGFAAAHVSHRRQGAGSVRQ